MKKEEYPAHIQRAMDLVDETGDEIELCRLLNEFYWDRLESEKGNSSRKEQDAE